MFTRLWSRRTKVAALVVGVLVLAVVAHFVVVFRAAALPDSRLEADMPAGVRLSDYVWPAAGPIRGLQDLHTGYGAVEIADGNVHCRPMTAAYPGGLLPDGSVIDWWQLAQTGHANGRGIGQDQAAAPWRWDAARGRYITYVSSRKYVGRDLGIVEYEPRTGKVTVVGHATPPTRNTGELVFGVSSDGMVWSVDPAMSYDVIRTDPLSGQQWHFRWGAAGLLESGCMAISPRGDEVACIGSVNPNMPNPWLPPAVRRALIESREPMIVVFACRLNGSNLRLLASERFGPGTSLIGLNNCRWSADGKRVAYQRVDRATGASLLSVPVTP